MRLEFDKVSVSFHSGNGNVEAVRDISFTAEDEVVVLLGPSGCGKTTLQRVVAGLTDPSTGIIAMEPEDNAYGLVPQDHQLLPWRSVYENIAVGLELSGVSRDKQSEIVHQLIQQLGLQGFEKSLPHELSGGMRQRVALGRAFAPSPSLLLLDEPFNALDAVTRQNLQGQLRQLCQANRPLVLMATHDIEEALILGDLIVVLSPRPGRIIDMIRVPPDQPRDAEYRRSDEFLKYRYGIEDLLTGEHKIEGMPNPWNGQTRVLGDQGELNITQSTGRERG